MSSELLQNHIGKLPENYRESCLRLLEQFSNSGALSCDNSFMPNYRHPPIRLHRKTKSFEDNNDLLIKGKSPKSKPQEEVVDCWNQSMLFSTEIQLDNETHRSKRSQQLELKLPAPCVDFSSFIHMYTKLPRIKKVKTPIFSSTLHAYKKQETLKKQKVKLPQISEIADNDLEPQQFTYKPPKQPRLFNFCRYYRIKRAASTETQSTKQSPYKSVLEGRISKLVSTPKVPYTVQHRQREYGSYTKRKQQDKIRKNDKPVMVKEYLKNYKGDINIKPTNEFV